MNCAIQVLVVSYAHFVLFSVSACLFSPLRLEFAGANLQPASVPSGRPGENSNQVTMFPDWLRSKEKRFPKMIDFVRSAVGNDRDVSDFLPAVWWYFVGSGLRLTAQPEWLGKAYVAWPRRRKQIARVSE